MPSRIQQRVEQVPTGDITGVTAGTALSGGGSSGALTINVIVADDDLILASQVYG